MHVDRMYEFYDEPGDGLIVENFVRSGTLRLSEPRTPPIIQNDNASFRDPSHIKLTDFEGTVFDTRIGTETQVKI
jgi:hypothetical protein